MLVSIPLFSGFSSVSTVPAGSLSKAELTGANTVNGPLPFNVSTSPAAFTAATSVVWSAELTALSTMSFDLNIGAPPTIGLSSIDFICARACWLASVIDATASSTMTNTLFTLIPSLSELILELDKYTEALKKRIADCQMPIANSNQIGNRQLEIDNNLGWRFEFEIGWHKFYRLQDAVGGFYAFVCGW